MGLFEGAARFMDQRHLSTPRTNLRITCNLPNDRTGTFLTAKQPVACALVFVVGLELLAWPQPRFVHSSGQAPTNYKYVTFRMGSGIVAVNQVRHAQR